MFSKKNFKCHFDKYYYLTNKLVILVIDMLTLASGPYSIFKKM